jgi:RNA polymerase sigma-70 factor (ECF subfamily)
MSHEPFLEHLIPTLPLLRAYLLAGTRNANDAEDLVQEVSSALWRNFEKYDASQPFHPWAIGFARLELLKWRQKRARDQALLSEAALTLLAESVIEVADEAETMRGHLAECLRALPERGRRIVTLKYLEGLSMQELATRLEGTVAAMEMACVRIRRSIRACIEKKLREENA